MPTGAAARKSKSRNTWELALLVEIVAGSCLGVWVASRSLPVVLVTAFVALAGLVVLTPGDADIHMGGLGFLSKMKKHRSCKHCS
jgi:hypothetical protein